MSNLFVYAGNDVTWNVQVYKDGLPLDLTGMVGASFLVKDSVDDADAAALITKTLGAGIGIVSLVNGQLTVTVTAANTVNQPSRTGVCSLMIEDAFNLHHTVYASSFSIIRAAVRSV